MLFLFLFIFSFCSFEIITTIKNKVHAKKFHIIWALKINSNNYVYVSILGDNNSSEDLVNVNDGIFQLLLVRTRESRVLEKFSDVLKQQLFMHN